MLAALVIIAVVAIWYVRHAQSRETFAPSSSGELCRTCGYDLTGTPLRCPECGTFSRQARLERLKTDWPTESITPRVPETGERWSKVYTADFDFEATLMQEHLQARGVPCEIASNAKSFLLAGSYTPTYTVLELMVPEGDFERAKGIIERLTQ